MPSRSINPKSPAVIKMTAIPATRNTANPGRSGPVNSRGVVASTREQASPNIASDTASVMRFLEPVGTPVGTLCLHHR
jgi:hypothetical protein